MSNLKEDNLKVGNLEKADLKEANLEGVNLEKANLEKTNLKKANLERANLKGANLREADLDLLLEDGECALAFRILIPHFSKFTGNFSSRQNSWNVQYCMSLQLIAAENRRRKIE